MNDKLSNNIGRNYNLDYKSNSNTKGDLVSITNDVIQRSINHNNNGQNTNAEEMDLTINLNKFNSIINNHFSEAEILKIQIEEFNDTKVMIEKQIKELELKYNEFMISDYKEGLIYENNTCYNPDSLKDSGYQLDIYLSEHGYDLNNSIEYLKGKTEYEKWVDEVYTPLFDKYFSEELGMTFEEYKELIPVLKDDLAIIKSSIYAYEQQEKLLPYLEMMETDEYKEYLKSAEVPTMDAIQNDYFGRVVQENMSTYQYLMSISEYLSEDDYYMLKYLGETKGKEAILGYLNAIEDRLNQSIGMTEAQAFIDGISTNGEIDRNMLTGALTAGKGTVDGIENFFEGLSNVFSTEGMISSNQYAQMYILETLGQEGLMNNVYELGIGLGNMLPSIAISILSQGVASGVGMSAGSASKIASVISSTSMGVSSFGNDKNQGLIAGNDLYASTWHGIFTGLSETSLGLLLGNIPGLNSDASLSIKGLLSEGLEEGLQEYVGAGLNAAFYGEDIDIGQLVGDSGKSFLYGIILSGFTNSTNLGFNVIGNGKKVGVNANNLGDFISIMNDSSVGVTTLEDGTTAFIINSDTDVDSNLVSKMENLFPNVDIIQQKSYGITNTIKSNRSEVKVENKVTNNDSIATNVISNTTDVSEKVDFNDSIENIQNKVDSLNYQKTNILEYVKTYLASNVRKFLYKDTSLFDGLNEQILQNGLYHFTNAADAILKSGYIKASNMTTSYTSPLSPTVKSFFFNGVPEVGAIATNLDSIPLKATAVKVNATNELVNDSKLKLRYVDDRAITYDGKFKLDGYKAEKCFFALIVDDGKLIYKQVSEEVYNNYENTNMGKVLSEYVSNKENVTAIKSDFLNTLFKTFSVASIVDDVNDVEVSQSENNLNVENEITDKLNSISFVLDDFIEQLGNGKGRRLLAMYALTANINHIPTEFRTQIEGISISDIKTYLNPKKINIGTQYFGESNNQVTSDSANNSTYPDDAAQRLVGNLKSNILYYPSLFLQQPIDALNNAFNNSIVRNYILGLNVKDFSNIINACIKNNTCKWLECDVFVEKILSMSDSEFLDFAMNTGTRKAKLIQKFVDEGGEVSGYLQIVDLLKNRFMNVETISNHPEYLEAINGFLPFTKQSDLNKIRTEFNNMINEQIYNMLSSNSLIEISKGEHVPKIENLDSYSTYIVKCEVYGEIREYLIDTYDGNSVSLAFIANNQVLKEAILQGDMKILSCEKTQVDTSVDASAASIGEIDVNKYSSSKDIYSTEVYGGNQSDVSTLITSYINKENMNSVSASKAALLYDIIKNYFPNATDMEVINIADAYASSGCGYMAISNAFCTFIGSMENGSQIFKEKFGFDLYLDEKGVRSYNLEAIALDIFCNYIKNKDIQSINSTNSYGISRTNYLDIVKSYFSKRDISVKADTKLGVDLKKTKESLLENILNSSGNSFKILYASNFDLEFISGIPVFGINGKDASLNGIEIDGNYLKGIGAHAMTITGVDVDGDLIVSSWSGKYKLISESISRLNNSVATIWTIQFDIMEVE